MLKNKEEQQMEKEEINGEEQEERQMEEDDVEKTEDVGGLKMVGSSGESREKQGDKVGEDIDEEDDRVETLRGRKPEESESEIVEKMKKAAKMGTCNDAEKVHGDSGQRQQPSGQTTPKVSMEERLERIRECERFVEQNGNVSEQVGAQLDAMTRCSKAQKSAVLAALSKWETDWKEKWSRLDTKTWLKPVVDVMGQAQVRDAKELAHLCDAAVAEFERSQILTFLNQHADKEMRVLQTKLNKTMDEVDNQKRENYEMVSECKRLENQLQKGKEELERVKTEKRKSEEEEDRKTVVSYQGSMWVKRRQCPSFEQRKGTPPIGVTKQEDQVSDCLDDDVDVNEGEVSGRNAREWTKIDAESHRKKYEKNKEWAEKKAKAQKESEAWRMSEAQHRSRNEIQKPDYVQSEHGKASRKSSKAASKVSRKTQSSVHEAFGVMANMMRASVMPEPNVFEGLGSCEDFQLIFMQKYESLGLADRDLVAILEEKYLKGVAKTIFQALPKRREKPLKELFVEFSKKLANKQGDAELHAQQEWECLQKKANQALWDYCIQLEKWSKKAYSNMSDEYLSTTRVVKLLNAVRGNEGLHSLLLMKRAEVPRAEQYDVLKAIVVQWESEKQRETGQRVGRYDKKRNTSSQEKPGDKEEPAVFENKEEEKNKAEGVIEDRGVTCFSCGEVGHMRRQCTARKMYAIGVKVDRKVKGRENIGKEVTEVCTILGQKRECVIDSGSGVSGMSTATWERLKRGCTDWKDKCEVFGPPSFRVQDAQRVDMPVRAQVRLQVEMRGRKAVVKFQVVDNKEEMCLVGTDAFEKLGIGISWKPRKTEVENKVTDRIEERKQVSIENKESESANCANRESCVKEMQANHGKSIHGMGITEMTSTDVKCCRKLVADGCQCSEKRCTVEEQGIACKSVRELALCILARRISVPTEETRLAIESKALRLQVDDEDKKEALMRFAAGCKDIVKLVMKGGEVEDSWKKAVIEVKKELEKKWQQKNSIPKSKICTTRSEGKGRGTPERRQKCGQTFRMEDDGTTDNAAIIVVERADSQKGETC